MIKQRTLIYIGASQLQLPAINWARQQGLKVVVTDSNPNAPGISIADEYWQLSGDDIDGLMSLAQGLAEQGTLAACYCGSDFGLPAVAIISARFNLPAASQAATYLALDKARAGSILQCAGVPVPEGACVTSLSDAEEISQKISLPVIVKPVDSSGSRGVRTVSEPSQLKEAFIEAQHFSNKVLIEPLIEGHHIDVNGLFIENHFYPCGLLDRFFSPRPFNYPEWGFQPCSLTETISNKVYKSVETGARALGINVGPVKADVIVQNDEPIILEIGPRFHGDVSSSFVTPLIANGHSAPQAWFAYLAGRPFKSFLPDTPKQEKRVVGWMAVFPDTAGEFLTIDGIENAQAVKGIVKICTLKKSGYRVDVVADNLAVMGFIWGEGDSRTALKKNLDDARNLLQVRMKQ